MKHPRPDNRPNWRDPNLLCIRNYTFRNGRNVTEVTPEFEQEWRQICMEINTQPSWRDDPMYHMSKRKPR